MLYSKLALVATLSAVALASPRGSPIEARANGGGGGGLTLDAAAVQTGSAGNGQNSIGSENGQAVSQTSNNNFINTCSGKTLTNGLQHLDGSCNGIVMGDIPAKTNMVSSTIIFPTTGGQAIASDTTFNISVQTLNLVAGSFTDADVTYYSAPQQLSGGKIIGHTHVTVQDMGGSLNPQNALDPTQFSFFKGINDAGNGQGLLQAVVTGGLPAGNYRVCTMAAAANHQPVLMPVAQRGTPDDCTKFTVSGSGTTINAAANNGAKGIAAAALASEAIVGATNSAFAASVIASESAAAAAAAAAAAGGAAAASSPAAANTAAAGGKGKGGKAASAAAAGTGSSSAAAAGTGSSSTAAAANTAAGGKGKGGGKAASTSPAAAAATTPATTTAAAGKASSTGKARGGKAGGGAGKGRGRGRKQRFAKREFVA